MTIQIMRNKLILGIQEEIKKRKPTQYYYLISVFFIRKILLDLRWSWVNHILPCPNPQPVNHSSLTKPMVNFSGSPVITGLPSAGVSGYCSCKRGCAIHNLLWKWSKSRPKLQFCRMFITCD